jgi:hypothetical protein
MENGLIKNEPTLLPQTFKNIGIIITVLAIAAMIVYKAKPPQFVQANMALAKIYIVNVLILGLVFIAWSRNKVEDEMTIALRFKSMAASFAGGVIYVLTLPLLDILFTDPVAPVQGQQVVLFMLGTYLISYSLQKATR